MNAIETLRLTKRYGPKTAEDSLCLHVENGELFALLGVNGAGKTTTIRMLSCLVRPTSGDALILGGSVLTSPETVKRRISVSLQETAVAQNLTVVENLELMAGIYGLLDRKKRAQQVVKELGLEEIVENKAKVLSGGWQRRLSIAMALITEPEVLFLDEPTLGLDVLARRELWEVIRTLRGRTTVVLTTHYLEEAEALSDHVGIMAAGRLQAVGTPEELKQRAGTSDFEEAFIRLASEKGAA